MKKISGWTMFTSALFFCHSCTNDVCIQSEPKETCPCVKVYRPICGCDGVTYGNECEAHCMGITDFSEGECGG